ncbi:3-hexulose-6-phosphate synthase [Paenibacillus dauci]|uniref:3-hexulose-6-phosphate synthase n=1 Tax=Paenibacillus dauci TaxID=1567106 RepID=UPI0009E55329|nr:3-hexulose-6-phosphate synthase [Paenibacillus dauci]
MNSEDIGQPKLNDSDIHHHTDIAVNNDINTGAPSAVHTLDEAPVRIQLALDRMTIEQAIDMAGQVQEDVDWIEVGTSLIKEFGMDSVRRMKEAFPHKVIVADIKTNDNAKYEFELCFRAGADVATVMASAPDATLDLCMQTAKSYGGIVMIDLLNVTPQRAEELQRYTEAVLCKHVSKDQQEHDGQALGRKSMPDLQLQDTHSIDPDSTRRVHPSIAAAGGITLDTLPSILQDRPAVVIVGSAITQAAHPAAAAREIRSRITEVMQTTQKGAYHV